MNTRVKRITSLNYFGGKARFLDWILPLLETPHLSYVEVFVGGASVFLNKKPSKCETINDIDGRLYNFFHILRTRPEELTALIDLTLYHRKEFEISAEQSPDELEDARRYFVRSLQSFAGHTDTSRRNSNSGWRVATRETRTGISSAVAKWMAKIEGLQEAVERLRNAQIENRDFRYIIKKYDHRDTLFYCDPPYMHADRTGKNDYKHELTNIDHIELADLLNSVSAKIAISGYDSPAMDRLYPTPKWIKHLGPDRQSNLSKTKKNREVIWTNYIPGNGINTKMFE